MQPSWGTAREALALCFRRTTMRRTVPIALIVGTILSAVNQAGVIMQGDTSWVTWLRVAANYLVPFCVSSLGFLSASKK